MGTDLMEILPEYFRPVLEFKHLMNTDSREMEELEQNIRRIRDNLFIQTCDSRTLGYYEGLLQLAGNWKLPLEARRNMILARYNTRPLYTFPVLKNMLSQAVGQGNYLARCRYGEHCLEVRVINQDMALARSVYTMVFFIKPAHLVLLFYAEYRGECPVSTGQTAGVRFTMGFYPQFNLRRLHLDSTWKLDGSRKLGGYDGKEPKDLYPVSLGFRAGIREDTRAAPHMGLLTGAGREPGSAQAVTVCTMAAQDPGTETGMRMQVSAVQDTGAGGITVYNRNVMDGTWKLNGKRKLNGGSDLRQGPFCALRVMRCWSFMAGCR